MMRFFFVYCWLLYKCMSGLYLNFGAFYIWWYPFLLVKYLLDRHWKDEMYFDVLLCRWSSCSKTEKYITVYLLFLMNSWVFLECINLLTKKYLKRNCAFQVKSYNARIACLIFMSIVKSQRFRNQSDLLPTLGRTSVIHLD